MSVVDKDLVEKLNNSDSMEAAINARIDDQLNGESIDPEARKVIFDLLLAKLKDTTDPGRHLGDIIEASYPELAPISDWSAEHKSKYQLCVSVSKAVASLKAIESTKLSCDHKDVYAGGVVSPGNRIYSAVEMAENGLVPILDNSFSGLMDADAYLAEKYAKNNGSFAIPVENREDRAVALLLEKEKIAKRALCVIIVGDDVNCGCEITDKKTASSLKTPAEYARLTLETLDAIQLERVLFNHEL